MLVKDYRGKNAEQEIWKFDGALVSQIKDTSKQAGEARLNARSLRRGCGFAVVDREDIGQHDLAGRTVDVDRKPGERGESLDSFAVLVENLDGFRQRE